MKRRQQTLMHHLCSCVGKAAPFITLTHHEQESEVSLLPVSQRRKDLTSGRLGKFYTVSNVNSKNVIILYN